MLILNEKSVDTCLLLKIYTNQKLGESFGEFRHLYMKSWVPISNISNLIFQSELMLEQSNIPPTSMMCRKSWKERQSSYHPYNEVYQLQDNPSMSFSQKNANSFIIRIHYRYHASWQGDIRWLNQNISKNFRSVLELIMLLEESISWVSDDGNLDTFSVLI